MLVLWLALRVRARNLRVHGGGSDSRAGTRKTGARTFTFTCDVCSKPLEATRAELVPLENFERGMVVRTAPEAAGRPLASYVCPHCESNHCFATDARVPEWLGANFYQPEETSRRCQACGNALDTPPWKPGEYDGRVEEAPRIQPTFGLRCPFCKAACCYGCISKFTRNRLKGGSLMCPRCRRHPVDAFYHG